MALPTAEEVTNMYLYDKMANPADLVADSLIRPKEAVASMDIDINEYIAGPGRFVTPGAFTIVERFFNPWLYTDSAGLGQKEADADGLVRYTKSDAVKGRYVGFYCY